MVIAESFGVGSPQKIAEVARENIQNVSSKHSFAEASEIKIGGLTWLTFDASATVSNIDIKYRFFVHADEERTVQIIFFTSPARFERNVPVMSRIAETFRFTEQE